jgi:hypothetical protein
MDAVRQLVDSIRIGHIDGEDENRHTTLGDSRLTRHDNHSTRVLGSYDHLAEDTASLVDRLEIDFLNEVETEFTANDLTGYQDYGRAIPVSLVQAIDEVQASRTAAAGNRREPIHQERLPLCGKRARFLVTHVDELDFALGQRGRKCIERIADDSVTVFNPCGNEGVDNDLRDFLAHDFAPALTLHLYEAVHRHHGVTQVRHDD